MNKRTQFNLYATPPHECSYLPKHQATTVFIDPHFPKDMALYDTLSQHGFRRSGEHLYRPHCNECESCVPVRIPVNAFNARRSQRRIWKKNQDLQAIAKPPEFNPEHFDLYCRYLESRHKGGGMDNPTPDSYVQFLTSSWANTVFYEFRLDQELLAVAVADHFETGMSAVYTFFEPQQAGRGLGSYAILWEIAETQRLKLDWLYLGYWIKNCQKMNYKTDYQPLEYYHNGIWQYLERNAS